MVEFETIEKERTDYGKYGGENFIEVSRNKVIKSDGSENTFIQIATGYYTEDGDQYKKRFTVPVNDKAVQHIIDTLPGILEKEKEAREAEDASGNKGEEEAEDSSGDEEEE